MTIRDIGRGILRDGPLRKRIGMLAVFALIYRSGTYILLPWIDPNIIAYAAQAHEEDFFWDRLIGTSLRQFSIASLGITPFITSSILMQMGGFSFPPLQRLRKEGAAGRNRINQIGRQVTIVVALVECLIFAFRIQPSYIIGGHRYFFWFCSSSVLLMVAGSMFAIWLAGKVATEAVGNGTSVLLAIGILAGLPKALVGEIRQHAFLFLLMECVLLLGIVVAMVVFMQAKRKIVLQYARQMSSSYHAGEHQHLPVKMNATGVMPIVFSNMMVGAFSFVAEKLGKGLDDPFLKRVAAMMGDATTWEHGITKALLVFVGTFMYASVFINPTEIANGLKQHNGFIAGVKPGKATARYIDGVMRRVLLPGAFFLACIALIPTVVTVKQIGISKEFAPFYGSSLFIIVGVIAEVFQQIEGSLHMSSYSNASQEVPYL